MGLFRQRWLQRACAISALVASVLFALMPTFARAIGAAKGELLMIQELCSTAGETRLVFDAELGGSGHSTVNHLEKCGYCTLLSHSPVIHQWGFGSLAQLDAPFAERPERFYSASPRSFAWTVSLARAPPR